MINNHNESMFDNRILIDESLEEPQTKRKAIVSKTNLSKLQDSEKSLLRLQLPPDEENNSHRDIIQAKYASCWFLIKLVNLMKSS